MPNYLSILSVYEIVYDLCIKSRANMHPGVCINYCAICLITIGDAWSKICSGESDE